MCFWKVRETCPPIPSGNYTPAHMCNHMKFKSSAHCYLTALLLTSSFVSSFIISLLSLLFYFSPIYHSSSIHTCLSLPYLSTILPLTSWTNQVTTWRGMMAAQKNLSSCPQSCTEFWENPAQFHAERLQLGQSVSFCNMPGQTLSGQLLETGQKETGHKQFTLPWTLDLLRQKKTFLFAVPTALLRLKHFTTFYY